MKVKKRVEIIEDARAFNRSIKRDLRDGIVSESALPEVEKGICIACYYGKRGCPRKSGILCLSNERAFRDSIIYTRKK